MHSPAGHSPCPARPGDRSPSCSPLSKSTDDRILLTMSTPCCVNSNKRDHLWNEIEWRNWKSCFVDGIVRVKQNLSENSFTTTSLSRCRKSPGWCTGHMSPTLTNQRPYSRSCDQSRPIRSKYSGHVIILDQSQASITHLDDALVTGHVVRQLDIHPHWPPELLPHPQLCLPVLASLKSEFVRRFTKKQDEVLTSLSLSPTEPRSLNPALYLSKMGLSLKHF